jgi:hypothetical protein
MRLRSVSARTSSSTGTNTGPPKGVGGGLHRARTAGPKPFATGLSGTERAELEREIVLCPALCLAPERDTESAIDELGRRRIRARHPSSMEPGCPRTRGHVMSIGISPSTKNRRTGSITPRSPAQTNHGPSSPSRARNVNGHADLPAHGHGYSPLAIMSIPCFAWP